MGRGLSELQKSILRLALENRDRDEHKKDDVDVLRTEVLHRHYGFPYRENHHCWWSGEVKCPIETRNDLYEHTAFSRHAITHQKYDAAQVAVTRAFHRLVKRNLIYRWYWTGKYRSRPAYGAKLTDEGAETVRGLMVNKRHDAGT